MQENLKLYNSLFDEMNRYRDYMREINSKPYIKKYLYDMFSQKDSKSAEAIFLDEYEFYRTMHPEITLEQYIGIILVNTISKSDLEKVLNYEGSDINMIKEFLIFNMEKII